MKSFIINSAMALTLVLAGVLNLAFAQSDAVPKNTEIKSWPAPLYWQPPAARAGLTAVRESSAKSSDGKGIAGVSVERQAREGNCQFGYSHDRHKFRSNSTHADCRNPLPGDGYACGRVAALVPYLFRW